jgi:hypothetical protein
LQTIIYDRIVNSKISYIEKNKINFSEDKKNILLIDTLITYCTHVNIDSLLLRHFTKLTIKGSWFNFFDKAFNILLELENNTSTKRFIKKNFQKILEKIIDCISNSRDAKEIPNLFKKYEISYDDYIESTKGFNNIIEMIQNVLNQSEEDLVFEQGDEIVNLTEVSSIYDSIDELKYELLDELFPNIEISYDFRIDIDQKEWEVKIEENLKRLALEEYSHRKNEDYYKDAACNSLNEENAIDNLFK